MRFASWGAVRTECTTSSGAVLELAFSTQTAFAAGSALAKAVFEFERARWGVKGRASRVGVADCTP